MPLSSLACSRKYVKSGSTRSIPGISSSGNDIPASTRIMPLSWRTAVMFLPISPNPPRGTTCKVLSPNNSSYNLLLKATGIRKSCSLKPTSVQVPSQVELLRPDGGKVYLVCSQVLFGEACYVLRGHGLDAGGDLFWSQELRPCYDATANAIHPRRCALQG